MESINPYLICILFTTIFYFSNRKRIKFNPYFSFFAIGIIGLIELTLIISITIYTIPIIDKLNLPKGLNELTNFQINGFLGILIFYFTVQFFLEIKNHFKSILILLIFWVIQFLLMYLLVVADENKFELPQVNFFLISWAIFMTIGLKIIVEINSVEIEKN